MTERVRKRRVLYPVALLRNCAVANFVGKGAGCRALPCGINTLYSPPHVILFWHIFLNFLSYATQMGNLIDERSEIATVLAQA